jgi:glycosyltransferase involved in cell wall biosynthesis
MKGLTLILPAYNEAESIEFTITEACASLREMEIDFEIIIVDDGSTDGTEQAVEEASILHPQVDLIQHATNRGYGAALRTGFEEARFDWIAFSDADGQFYFEDLANLIEKTNSAPIVVGYRMDRQDPWLRRAYSWVFNRIVRTFFGTQVRDCDCAFKLFHRAALSQILPESRGFLVNTEMLSRARRLGFNVVEVGVRHRARHAGVSKVSIREIPRVLGQLGRLFAKRLQWPVLPTNWIDSRHFHQGMGQNKSVRSEIPTERKG